MAEPYHFVIFSGFNSRAVVAFCRAATKDNVPFHIVARCGADPILQTIYADRVVLQRDTDSLSPQLFLEVVSAIRRKGVRSKLTYVPSTEYLSRYVLAKRRECEAAGLEVDLVDRELYETLSDKSSFYNLCVSSGIPVPKQDADPLCIGFPCVAKPKTYFGDGNLVHSKPVFLTRETDLKTFLADHSLAHFVFQEYVQGRSHYLLFYCSSSGKIVSCSQRNLIQQHDGGSIVAAVPAQLHQEGIGCSYKTLLERLGFQGFVMIELRERMGKYLMIEANPRLWGPIQLTLDTSAGLFEAYFSDHGYDARVPDVTEVADARYFWMGGLLATAKARRNCVFHSFSASDLCLSLDRWLESDVWKRPDSTAVFLSELSPHEKRSP